MQQFSRQVDDDAPRKLDVVWLGANGTDISYEIDTFALGRHQMNSAVVVDLTQKLFVPLVAALSTTHSTLHP